MGNIVQACYGIKGRVQQIALARLADELIAEGGRLVNIAAASKTFRNRTGNLINSFGSTLYVNGKEYTGPSGHLASGLSEMSKRQGSDYARRYAREHNTMISPNGTGGNASRGHKHYAGLYADEWEGALALDDFFDHYNAPTGRWQLVVVAALFYGGILEKKYNIKVISQIEGEMSTLAAKYHGTVKTHDGYGAGQ